MEDKQALLEAMNKAEQAFENHLSEEEFDAAYFDLRLEGYLLNRDFTKPLDKVVFEEKFKTENEE